MKERIAQIIQKEDMTAAQFAEKIGISPSSFSLRYSGEAGRSGVNNEFSSNKEGV